MLADDELPAWLRLIETPGIGRASARRLLAGLASPEAVFGAPLATLGEFVNLAAASALQRAPAAFDALLVATRAWLAGATAEAPRSIVCLGDPDYPQALLQTADPPLLLYLLGRVDLLRRPALAVVGSRRPTPQGVENARAIAADLGQRGLTIVSGLALGIDAAAHQGGLATPASSIAVVGTGLDIVYPACHRELARRLSRDGLLVSEFRIGTAPLAGNFPQRNRIIAGISSGTLIVEAALRSGSLITARLALEAGRDVFAVPGSIRSMQSRGCHALIKHGAKLVESADDVTDELGTWQGSTAAPVAAADPAAEPAGPDAGLLEALGHDPVSLDALLARTGLGVDALGAALLGLELAGRVARLPGQLFQRIGSA